MTRFAIFVISRRIVAPVAALALTSCGVGAPPIKVDTYQPFEFTQGLWHPGRSLFFVVPLPRFSRSVRIVGVRLTPTDHSPPFATTNGARLLVLDHAMYNGAPLNYGPLNLDGGVTVDLSSRVIKPAVNADLQVAIPIDAAHPGCHEASVAFDYVADRQHRSASTRWFVAIDSNYRDSKGHLGSWCEAPVTHHNR